MTSFDILIIGAGIAGTSLAYRLGNKAKGLSVGLVDMEGQPGAHATGRSAAFFSETYGNETIRSLTAASRAFFKEPPQGFSEVALLEPSGALFIARSDQMAALDEHYETTRGLAPSVRIESSDFACALVPVLKPDQVAACVYEPDSEAIDVHALLQGYVGGARRAGVSLLTDHHVRSLSPVSDSWQVGTSRGSLTAKIIVNAAGAWAGQVGDLAGAMDIGLQPLRRSVCVIDPAKVEGISAEAMGGVRSWPLVLDIDEAFYFKPSGGMIWLSPAEEEPSVPCDAAPDELTLAGAVEQLETMTTLKVRRLEHKWAGLRSFVGDRSPVAGFDPDVAGFFWLAGQGGYGIQTSPALSSLAADLVLQGQIAAAVNLPDPTLASALAPERLRGMAPLPAGGGFR